MKRRRRTGLGPDRAEEGSATRLTAGRARARRGWLAPLALAAVLIVGCSTGSGTATVEEAPPPDDPAEEPLPAPDTPTVPPSSEQLRSVLLSPDDLVGPWTEAEPIEDAESGGEDGGSPPCFSGLDGAAAAAPASATATYVQGEDRSLDQFVMWLGDGAADQFDLIVQGLDGCRNMSFLTQFGPVDGAMGPLRIDVFGDEAEAYRLLYTDLSSTVYSGIEATTLTYDFAVVRVDEVVMVITRGELGPVPSSPSELELVVATAVDKVERVGTSGLATT